MVDVIAPDAFDENFTIYLNSKGKPVQRRLRDMTPDEVMAAIEWNSEEADRLEMLAAPFKTRPIEPLQEAFEAGALTGVEFVAQLEHGAMLLEASAIALNRSARLDRAVIAVMNLPEHAKYRPMVEVLRRYWPGGRHAA